MTQEQLELMGLPKGSDLLERREFTWHDVIKIAQNAAMSSEYDIFKNVDKNRAYQNEVFPNTANGVMITHMRVTHNLVFATNANDLQMPDYLRHFHENSVIQFKREDNIIGEYFLSDLIEVATYPSAPEATTDALVAVKDRIRAYYPFQLPIIVGKGANLYVKLVTAPSLTTDAVIANREPYLPTYSSSDTTNWFYSIDVKMKGYKWRQIAQ